MDISEFYIIAVVSNPVRYRTRWRLFKEFMEHMKDMGAQVLVVEQAYGRREPQVCEDYSHNDRDTTQIIDENKNGIDDRIESMCTSMGFARPALKHDPFHLVVRTNAELWHKENLINLGIQHLTKIRPKWKYVAWIDADVIFQRRDIIMETAQQLQHYDIVQMFSHVVDMGPEYQPIKQFNGFMWSYMNNDRFPPMGPGTGGYYAYDKKAFWHCGYAWAATRDAMERISLFDKGILGAGDHHMALALIGCAAKSLPAKVSPGYRDSVLSWEAQALHEIKKNVGYVPGLITHNWHGNKKNRKYVERWDILVKNKFDPVKDLIRDNQGMYRLNMAHGERSIRLRDDIRQYFRARDEDCTYYVPGESN